MNRISIPLVSVIITTYKRADFLGRAIDSVLNQTYENIEIIVVDDNNPETEYRQKTEEIMAQFAKEEKVKYFKHPQNLNGAVARNTGLKNARGKYVTYLDDDDTYRPAKVEEQVKFLENSKNFDAVYCGWKKDGKEETPDIEGDLSYEVLSGELVIRTNTIMMNTSISLEFEGWDESYTRNQEAVYLLRFFSKGYKIGSVQKVLVDYDTSDRSNASNAEKNEKDFKYFLSNHKELIEKINTDKPGAKKNIFVMRMRGVFLTYLKNKDYKNAWRVYSDMLLQYPASINKDLLKYVVRRYFSK